MAETLRSDGRAVEVVLTATVAKGDIVAPGKNTADGWHGIAMHSGVSGNTIAIEVAAREHELPVGAVAAAKGAVLYLDSSGVVTATSTSNRPFIKVTKAKNAGNFVWGILLPQLG